MYVHIWPLKLETGYVKRRQKRTRNPGKPICLYKSHECKNIPLQCTKINVMMEENTEYHRSLRKDFKPRLKETRKTAWKKQVLETCRTSYMDRGKAFLLEQQYMGKLKSKKSVGFIVEVVFGLHIFDT